MELSSSSSSEDEGDYELQQDSLLPSIGPPAILQYVRESKHPPFSNEDVPDMCEQADMLKKSMYSGPCMFCEEEVLPFPTLEEMETLPANQVVCYIPVGKGVLLPIHVLVWYGWGSLEYSRKPGNHPKRSGLKMLAPKSTNNELGITTSLPMILLPPPYGSYLQVGVWLCTLCIGKGVIMAGGGRGSQPPSPPPSPRGMVYLRPMDKFWC